ncbi:MAG: NUDIX domain-containing protein [Candidatus Heimdallarchaeota archaeon]|nr:NUDIX domain-containing protein [Candidatus Heimdallarchaeota archaeon]
MKKRYKIIPTAHLILIQNNRILLQRRFNTGYEDGKYSVVAGHLEGTETFRQAMVREAKEEAGIDILPNDLEVVHVVHRCTPNERIDLFLQAKKWTGEPKIMEHNRADDLNWFELDNLPVNIIPYVKKAINCILKREIYSEFGW